MACLRSYRERVERLYLVGDVFDAFIEYGTMIPKGFVRFQGLLAAWTDRGVPVTYLVGNHDPWHIDYFTNELGVRVLAHPLTEHVANRRVHIAHGDGIDPAERSYRLLRPVLRHPLAARLYRTVLPGDSGLRLARHVSRSGDDELDPGKAAALRDHALTLLRTDAADVVVMGHTHLPECIRADGGTYVNLGGWCDTRTFATLDEDGPKLLRWNGDCAVPVTTGSSKPDAC